MEMSHPSISVAEKKYRPELTGLCRKFFRQTVIPSHDHLHHARVWRNAKVLLNRLYGEGMITDALLPEKVIIAAYFHDTGLTINRGYDHGMQSREICSEYLKNIGMTEKDKLEILDAIEKHDDKDYASASDPTSLPAIISVADDMDAFGKKGIERYDEIYALRGVNAGDMPRKIIANAKSRYEHLARTYGIFPDFAEKQKKRLDILISHYQKLIP